MHAPLQVHIRAFQQARVLEHVRGSLPDSWERSETIASYEAQPVQATGVGMKRKIVYQESVILVQWAQRIQCTVHPRYQAFMSERMSFKLWLQKDFGRGTYYRPRASDTRFVAPVDGDVPVIPLFVKT